VGIWQRNLVGFREGPCLATFPRKTDPWRRLRRLVCARAEPGRGLRRGSGIQGSGEVRGRRSVEGQRVADVDEVIGDDA
jgi:hypothetical protein